jgi:hypothetical protein
MKHSKEQLDAVFDNLLKAYQVSFGQEMTKEKLLPVLGKHLSEMEVEFVLNRVKGLDPLGIQYLMTKFEEPQVAPEPVVLEVKKRGRPAKA